MHFKNPLFSHSRYANTSRTRGFGLIELMVSVSIMTLVSTVILVKNRTFNDALLLRTQAYEVAFALRQVQLLAVSGNRETSTSSDRYGVYFNLTSQANDHRYQFFNDNGASANWYNITGTPPDTLLGSAGSIDRRYRMSISDITGATTDNTRNVAITFERPNFDALFYSGAGVPITGPLYIKITPRVTTGYNTVPFRLVEITSTGQISVK